MIALGMGNPQGVRLWVNRDVTGSRFIRHIAKRGQLAGASCEQAIAFGNDSGASRSEWR
jgi:hypothetical protein